MTDRRRSSRLAAAAVLLLAAGAARAKDSNVQVSGSVYADFWGVPDRAAQRRASDAVTPEASLKVGVDIHDDLAFSAKACTSCHGIEMDHVYLDYMPTTWFNVQVGRIPVPFGEYAQRVDPSGHKTASAPLVYDMGRMAYGEKSAMNLGVLPQPYTDTGVLLYGVAWMGPIQAWYGVYGVAGLKGTNDLDWMALRAAPYTDNNDQPGGGARIALTKGSDGDAVIGDVNVGGSVTAGRYDRDGKRDYLIWGVDASFRVGPFTVRGEYVTSRIGLDPAAAYRFELVDDFFKKEGAYAELEHPLGRYLSLVYRWDLLRRAGMPLPGSSADLSLDSRITRWTAGFLLTPVSNFYVKGSWEYWEPNDFGRFHSYHVGVGGAF